MHRFAISAAAAVLLSLAPITAAQLSPEEAQSRLAQRRAEHAATTQPAADQVAELRQIIATMRAENLQLKAQIASLKLELKKRPTAPDANPAQETASAIDPLTAIRKGMTLAEAEKAIGKKLDLTGTTDYGQVYHAVIPGGTTTQTVQPNVPDSPRRFDFRMPKAQQVQVTWYRQVTVGAKDGKITSSTWSKTPPG